MKRVLYPGSFDPIHRGHIDIAARVAQNFGTCVIAVGQNADKKTLFSQEKRVEMAEQAVSYYQKHLAKDGAPNIEVVGYDGLTIDAAVANGCSAIIRGARSLWDVNEEKRLKWINKKLLAIRFNTEMEQIIFKASPDYDYLSSTDVKKLCEAGEYILAMSYVLPPTHNELMKIFLEKDYHQALGGFWWQAFIKPFEGRSYHNLSHIAYMINRLAIYKRQGGKIENEQNLQQAIFYHDYSENEEESASAIPYTNKELRSLVRATKHLDGQEKTLSGDEQIIHDLDLSILFDKDNYSDYANCVKDEYADTCSEEEYRQKRREVLDILSQTVDYKIFPPVVKEWAIRNMGREKENL